jgi:hypothetical protein
VDVVAFVPTQLLSHLRVVLRSGHTLIPVGSWPELHFVVQHRGAHVVVADPAASGEMRVESLEELQRQFPSLSIVLYMQLSPTSVQAIVRLAKSGIEHVVLSRFDDEPDRFLELLERIPAHLLSDQMLRELAARLPASRCR